MWNLSDIFKVVSSVTIMASLNRSNCWKNQSLFLEHQCWSLNNELWFSSIINFLLYSLWLVVKKIRVHYLDFNFDVPETNFGFSAVASIEGRHYCYAAHHLENVRQVPHSQFQFVHIFSCGQTGDSFWGPKITLIIFNL